MNILKKEYNILIGESNATIKTTSNINIVNMNAYSIILFENYKTHKLNKLYSELLPTKIKNLQALNKRLIGLKFAYKNILNNNTDINELNAFIDIVKSEYKHIKAELEKDRINPFNNENIGLFECLEHNKEQTLKSNAILNNFLISFNMAELNDLNVFLGKLEFKINSVCSLINYINKRINHYKKELANKNAYFEYTINEYDLNQFKKGIITQNVKRYFYFYLIKLKKHNISKRTNAYLNLKIIKQVTSEYTYISRDTPTEELIYNDFYKDFAELCKPYLSNFENTFLYRTL